jgi:hypothetical protein
MEGWNLRTSWEWCFSNIFLYRSTDCLRNLVMSRV